LDGTAGVVDTMRNGEQEHMAHSNAYLGRNPGKQIQNHEAL